MIEKSNNILLKRTRKDSPIKRSIPVFLSVMLLLCSQPLFAQVINNTGAFISVSSAVVNSKDLSNTLGSLGNNGTINLTGDFYNAGTSGGNGVFNLTGNWKNDNIFNPGTSTVSFNGITNQTITHWSSGENFYNLTIINPGNFITQVANPGSSLTINNDLTITAGTLSLDQTTLTLSVGGRATITGSLIFNNITTQTAAISNILSGPGAIDMSGGNLPHVLNLAGSSNGIGTFSTSPASSSTVNYNGTTQTVFAAPNYRNLTISNSGIKTLLGNSIVGLRLNISGGTFDLGTTATTLTVQNGTLINGSMSFNGTSAKTVVLNDSLTGTGSIDMSGGNLSHFLNLYGTVNSIGTYSSGGGSTVDYLKNGDQSVFTSDDYRNLKISGSGNKNLIADIKVKGILTMLSGDIYANGNTLTVENGLVSAISWTAGKIIGKLQRVIGTTGNEYLYPIGSASFYNPLKIKFRNPASSTITAQFKAQDIGNAGLPLDDDDEQVWDRFTEGYWTLTSSYPMSSSDYNVNLTFNGFTGVDRSSRIIKRTDGGNLEVDGKHDSISVFPEIKRDSLLKGISTITTDLAIGRGRARIISQPSNIDICEGSNAFFEVTARGRKPLIYKWQVNSGSGFTDVIIGGVYGDPTLQKLIITGASYSMNGYLYQCIITDAQGNVNTTIPALLTVNKIPVAVATPSVQDACPAVAFQTIVLSTANNVTGTTFAWTRDNPAGISTTLPLSGTAIADQISGIFTNLTDSPITVTFTIIPTGPFTTYCVGNSITAKVNVNPTPRFFPVPSNTSQCDSTTTNIQLQSPSTFTSGFVYFNYTVTSTGPVSGYITPTNGLSNNSFITDKLINLTNVFQVVTYSVTPVSPVPGCAMGATKSFTVTVNPTPRVQVFNLPVMNADSSICFGGTTNILLTSLTQMSPGYGNIRFDYKVSATGGGVVTGIMTPDSNRIPNYRIIRSYQNYSDTLQSVYFAITPKLDNAVCHKGPVVVSKIKVHPKPARGILIVKPLTCEGGSDATLSAITSKGTGPQRILWTGPFSYIDSSLFTITNRKGGMYTMKITDNLQCSSQKDTVIQGAFINSMLFAYPKAANPNGTQYGITCPTFNDGDLVFSVIDGGTPVYEYWITRNTLDTIGAPLHGTFSLTGDPHTFSNLYPGKYTLFVKDANGCYNIRTIGPGLFEYIETTIAQPDTIKPTFGKKNVSCKAYSDGKVWVQTTTGGNGGYAYIWKNSGGSVIGSSDTITGLIAGKYYLVTTDIKNCTKLDSVIITEPSGMGLSSVVLKTSQDGNFNISCNGGSDGKITLNITGGSGSYSYQWSGPDGTVTTTVNEISGLKAGHYTAIVKDVNNCTLSPLDTILTQPAVLNLTDSLSLAPDGSNNINCFGGSGKVYLTVTGGSIGNYKFDWSPVNTPGLIAGQKDQLNLIAGNYHVVVKDTNGCSVPKDIVLKQPLTLNTILVPKHITCFPAGFSNGSIDLTVAGGITPYVYNWSNGATSEDISSLTQGYYKVTVKDFNGCPKVDSVKINLPPYLTYSSNLSSFNDWNISCLGYSDGSIKITPITGKAPYLFSWNGPGAFSSANQNISGLKAGTYNMQITDSNLCTATGTFNLNEPPKINMNIAVSTSSYGGFNINCAGASTGTININPVNNVGNVSYLWSDGDTSKMRSNLPAGSYGIIITDRNYCRTDSSVVLTQPDTIKTSFTVKQAFCPDSPDGEIQLNIKGGVIVSDYIIKWSDNSTSQNLSNILRGKYKVTVTDANNCIVRDSVVMTPVNETCLIIYNAISPNNDNINDVWNIGKIELYPQAEVKVFNRWGELLWRSERGYPHPWDGRSNGTILPIDSYTYIIDLHNGSKPILGTVTIVR